MLSDSDIKAAKRWVKEILARVPDEREPKQYHGANVQLAEWLKGYMDRVEKLEARNKELYEVLQIAENVGVDEGLFEEEERMTERIEPPLTAAGKLACELAEGTDDEPTHQS